MFEFKLTLPRQYATPTGAPPSSENQAVFRRSGIRFLLQRAGDIVTKEPTTERQLVNWLVYLFGFHRGAAKEICRMMIGPKPGSHIFRKAKNGVLIPHPGELTKHVRG